MDGEIYKRKEDRMEGYAGFLAKPMDFNFLKGVSLMYFYICSQHLMRYSEIICVLLRKSKNLEKKLNPL